MIEQTTNQASAIELAAWLAARDNLTIGPILLGTARPAHILTSTATVRRIVNLTALTVVEAGAK